jgi:4-amino-4-deoxy-L-arabinose transferase-like glycosyltransferase
MMAPNLAPRSAQPALLRLSLLAILLLAFALRAYHLDFQSFWSDEGISLQRAALPLPQMLAEMPVEHLPGYFLLLHFWLPLTGGHDYAIRFLSLWPSVLSVALIYRLGVDLGNRPAGVGAALLLASGGFQLWYAQEARMYSWLLAASLVSTVALVRLLEIDGARRVRWAWGTLYALATAATVYLHLFGALTPLAQAIFVTGWALARRDGRSFGRWLAAAAAALLLFLPWLPRVLGIFNFGGWREAGDPAEIPWRYLAAFTVSDAMPDPGRTPLVWLYALLALAGVACWWRVWKSSALLLATLLLPMLAVIGLALRNPDYHERYAIAVSAPLLLLAAGGAGWLDWRSWRAQPDAAPQKHTATAWLPALALGALAAANLVAVQRLYTDTTLHKPDFRGAAQTILAGLQPGDVVLVDGPDPSKVFLHYYTGTAPVIAVADLEEATLEEANDRLRELTAGAAQVWELLYFHAPATVQVWLATQGWATEPTYHNGIRVTRYGLESGAGIATPLGIDFGAALRLERATLDTLTPQPGDLLRVSTDWFTNAAAPEYKFSLRLQDAAGNVVQSVDYTPQNWFAPTHAWVVGQPARDQRGLLLPADLLPGDYRLTLRLYDPASGAAVVTAAGEDVMLAELTVR